MLTLLLLKKKKKRMVEQNDTLSCLFLVKRGKTFLFRDWRSVLFYRTDYNVNKKINTTILTGFLISICCTNAAAKLIFGRIRVLLGFEYSWFKDGDSKSCHKSRGKKLSNLVNAANTTGWYGENHRRAIFPIYTLYVFRAICDSFYNLCRSTSSSALWCTVLALLQVQSAREAFIRE